MKHTLYMIIEQVDGNGIRIHMVLCVTTLLVKNRCYSCIIWSRDFQPYNIERVDIDRSIHRRVKKQI
jgi:hypothetical protein